MSAHGGSPITGDCADETALWVSSCATLATLVPVLLYQTRAIGSLPDPPSAVFDSEKITDSKAAHPFGVPDSIPGLLNFGATLALIALSRRNRIARQALGAKLLLDGSFASFNLARQVTGFGKLCSWCTGTALAAGVTVFAGRRVIAQSLSGNWTEEQ